MNRTEFQPLAPGRLVDVEFIEPSAAGPRHFRGPAFVPDPLPPGGLDPVAVTGGLFRWLDAARSHLTRLDVQAGHLPDPRLLLRALTLREAQASSHIENTVASLDEMALAESTGAAPRTEIEEVRRNARMIESGLGSSLPLGTTLVRSLHRELIDDERHTPGDYRRKTVYIGDKVRGFDHATFVPPPQGEVPALMDQWAAFVRLDDGATPWPALLRLALSHYQFEAIHPFSDGNGRLGRALVNIGAVRLGVVGHPVCNLSEWVQSHRDEYYRRLKRVSTHAEWFEWCEFFVRAIAEQARADLDRAERIIGLRREYHRRVSTKRSSPLLLTLIDELFVKQAVTIPAAAARLGITYRAAKSHVVRLVDEGVLRPVDSRKSGKVYLAGEILAAIRGPTSGR